MTALQLSIRHSRIKMAGMNEMQRFGGIVERAMNEAGLNQVRLAHMLGWSQSTVSQLIAGKRSAVTVDMLRSLESVLVLPRRESLIALGYLDPEEREPGVTYVVREDDPRTLLLDAVAGQPPSEVDRYAAILRMIVGGANEGIIEDGQEHSAAGA